MAKVKDVDLLTEYEAALAARNEAKLTRDIGADDPVRVRLEKAMKAMSQRRDKVRTAGESSVLTHRPTCRWNGCETRLPLDDPTAVFCAQHEQEDRDQRERQEALKAEREREFRAAHRWIWDNEGSDYDGGLQIRQTNEGEINWHTEDSSGTLSTEDAQSLLAHLRSAFLGDGSGEGGGVDAP